MSLNLHPLTYAFIKYLTCATMLYAVRQLQRKRINKVICSHKTHKLEEAVTGMSY